MSDEVKQGDDQGGATDVDTGDTGLSGQAGKGAEADRAEAERKGAVERGADAAGAVTGSLQTAMPSSMHEHAAEQGQAGEQRGAGVGVAAHAPAPRLSFEGLPPEPIGGIAAYFEARETRIVQWVHDLLAHHGIGGQPQPLPNPAPSREA